jgi:endoglucanase
LLGHAKSLYNFALHAKGGQRLYQESVPEIADSYSSSSYQDELTLAAIFLALASNSTDLYQEAQDLYNKFHLAAQDRALNWDSKGPAIPVLFAQVAQKWKNDTGSWKADAEKYFDRILDNSGQGTLTNGGLLFYDGDSDEASLNPALNAAMLLSRYAPIATTDERKKQYQAFADDQFAYVLGKNPMSGEGDQNG